MEQLYVVCVGQHHKISVTQHHIYRQRLFDCDLAAAQPDDMLAQYSMQSDTSYLNGIVHNVWK